MRVTYARIPYLKKLNLFSHQFQAFPSSSRARVRVNSGFAHARMRNARTISVTRATMNVVDIALHDGEYDAFVVWAEARDDGRVAFDLTITTGAHKGDVVTVHAKNVETRDVIDFVGLPCTLHVSAGQPRISWE
jgi:hypothetical protein